MGLLPSLRSSRAASAIFISNPPLLPLFSIVPSSGGFGSLTSWGKPWIQPASPICFPPRFQFMKRRIFSQGLNLSGKKKILASVLGFTIVNGKITHQPCTAFALDDDLTDFEAPSGYLKDELHAFWALVRKFLLPAVLVITVLLGWRHPVTLAINVALLLFSTRPNPLSVYIFIEQVQSSCKRRSLQRVLYQTCQAPDPSSAVVFSYVLADVYAKLTFFCNHLGVSGFPSVSRRGNNFRLYPHNHMKAVAIVDSKLVSASSENRNEQNKNLSFTSNLDSKMLESSNEDTTTEIDEREKMRRTRISKANKGNVPWNKGRKHCAETLRRIRERTRLAMQDPKIRIKLAKLGRPQSEEAKIKIGVGVREGWQRRRQKLIKQETCLFEWQNIIAEAAREGSAGEDKLQWDSYEILGEQLKQEWLQSIEKRKTMPRPKGNKRTPKSPEQRKKISEAISAKWANPEYRDRVCNAITAYHGSPVGAERRQRRKVSSGTPLRRDAEKKKPAKSNSINHDVEGMKKVIIYNRKRTTPQFKDPLASSKLEMIKKIRAQREESEMKRKEATGRAKLLIAEAEKAAQALETAALKNPLARASLLETRKLITEATQFIGNIESGLLTSLGIIDEALLNSDEPISQLQNSPANLNGQKWLNGQLENRTYLLSSNESSHKYLKLGKLTPPGGHTGRELWIEGRETTGEISGDRSLLHNESLVRKSATTDNQMVFSQVSGSIRHKNLKSEVEQLDTSDLRNSETFKSSLLKTKKKWVRGRLVEMEVVDVSKGGIARDK